jgi:predicted nucleic acid-binding protein
VLDTNVVSELMRPAPDPMVLKWLLAQHAADRATTAVTVAEMRYGIERLPAGKRRDALERNADAAFGEFSAQVLPFDAAAAARYAEIVVRRERAGRPIEGFDAQIAAICAAHGARLATRDIGDFENAGIDVIDPWREGAEL